MHNHPELLSGLILFCFGRAILLVMASGGFIWWFLVGLVLKYQTMELRHLKYFVFVAEEMNFNRAAARLRVSQPAVSRQIADLEDHLGVSLFLRNRNGVTLTSEGEIMLAHARKVLQCAWDAMEAMRVLQKRPHSENLVIGYVAAEMGGMLTAGLRRAELLLPNVTFDLMEMSPQEQVEKLILKELDIVFIGSPYKHLEDQVAFQILQKQNVYAVIPDNHQFALRKEVALKKLSGEIFIGFCEKKFPGRNDAIINACQSAGFTPNIRHLAESLSAVLALVAVGKGVTLAPREPNQLPQLQTFFLNLNPPIPQMMSVAAFRKDDNRNSIKKLVELCMEGSNCGNVQIQDRTVHVMPHTEDICKFVVTQAPTLLKTNPKTSLKSARL